METVQVKECIGLLGKLFGHKFEGRWSTHHEDAYRPDALAFIYNTDLTKLKNHIHTRTYAGDVCVRCGATVNSLEPEFHP